MGNGYAGIIARRFKERRGAGTDRASGHAACEKGRVFPSDRVQCPASARGGGCGREIWKVLCDRAGEGGVKTGCRLSGF